MVLTPLPGRTPETEDIDAFVETHVRRDAYGTIVCDLTALETINSLFVARLVTLNKYAGSARRRLVLCGMRPHVREEFSTLRLDRLFEIRGGGHAVADWCRCAGVG